MKAVFWLGFMFLMLIPHIYVLSRFVNFLYVIGRTKRQPKDKTNLRILLFNLTARIRLQLETT